MVWSRSSPFLFDKEKAGQSVSGSALFSVSEAELHLPTHLTLVMRQSFESWGYQIIVDK